MSPRYSYRLHSAHRHPLHARPLQEPQEEEAEEEAEEAEEEAEEAEEEAEEAEEEAEEAEEEEEEAEEVEEEQTLLPRLASDSAEILPKYSQEKEKEQTASSPNSNAII